MFVWQLSIITTKLSRVWTTSPKLLNFKHFIQAGNIDILSAVESELRFFVDKVRSMFTKERGETAGQTLDTTNLVFGTGPRPGGQRSASQRVLTSCLLPSRWCIRQAYNLSALCV